MRRHVPQVAGVGHEVPQPVGHVHRRLGRRRHLHEVDVEVQHPRVLEPTGQGHRALEHLARLHGPGPGRGRAGRDVPQLPGGEVHQRVGVQHGDVEVVGVLGVHAAHRVGVRRVPHREVRARVGARIAVVEGRGQRLLHRCGCRGLRPLQRLAASARPWCAAPARRRTPTACCSWVPARRRRPTTPSRTRGRSRALARSRRRPPRGGTRRSTPDRGRTTPGPRTTSCRPRGGSSPGRSRSSWHSSRSPGVSPRDRRRGNPGGRGPSALSSPRRRECRGDMDTPTASGLRP